MDIKDGTFDAQAEVDRIRFRRAEARRKLFRKSRLDKYRFELSAMSRAGASCADLNQHLYTMSYFKSYFCTECGCMNPGMTQYIVRSRRSCSKCMRCFPV